MGLKHFAAYALLAVGSSALPQTTASTTASTTGSSDVSPSQSSEFKAAAASYFRTLRQDPAITNLAFALALADNGDAALGAIQSNPSTLIPITGTIDLQSFATAPPLTFPSYTFYSGLDTNLVDSIKSLQTSAVLALASIDQSILGTSTSLSVPSPTSASTSNSQGAAAGARPTGVYAVGAAVGALGAAVAML